MRYPLLSNDIEACQHHFHKIVTPFTQPQYHQIFPHKQAFENHFQQEHQGFKPLWSHSSPQTNELKLTEKSALCCATWHWSLKGLHYPTKLSFLTQSQPVSLQPGRALYIESSEKSKPSSAYNEKNMWVEAITTAYRYVFLKCRKSLPSINRQNQSIALSAISISRAEPLVWTQTKWLTNWDLSP